MRLAIVHGDETTRASLGALLALQRGISVLWAVASAEQAEARCTGALPDVVLVDVKLEDSQPRTVQRVALAAGGTVLLLTTSLRDHRATVFRALGAGARDVVELPAGPLLADHSQVGVLLETLSNMGGMTSRRPPLRSPAPAVSEPGGPPPLVAIGASAGGPTTLAHILAELPEDLPAAIIIAQHIDAAFTGSLIDWLEQRSNLPVLSGRSGGQVEAGQVYLSPGAQHISVTARGTLRISAHPQDSIYYPSVDVLLRSVAMHWPGEALGVVLTGMGRDGATGLLEMRQKGFRTLAQDGESAAVDGMPKAALTAGAVSHRLPLDRIAGAITRWARRIADDSMVTLM